jgi:hypothetical protein
MNLSINLTAIFNQSVGVKDCGELYLNAIDSVTMKVGPWLFILLMLVVIDFAAMRLYNHGWARFGIEKYDYKIYKMIHDGTIWGKIVAVFSLIGFLFLHF